MSANTPKWNLAQLQKTAPRLAAALVQSERWRYQLILDAIPANNDEDSRTDRGFYSSLLTEKDWIESRLEQRIQQFKDWFRSFLSLWQYLKDKPESKTFTGNEELDRSFHKALFPEIIQNLYSNLLQENRPNLRELVACLRIILLEVPDLVGVELWRLWIDPLPILERISKQIDDDISVIQDPWKVAPYILWWIISQFYGTGTLSVLQLDIDYSVDRSMNTYEELQLVSNKIWEVRNDSRNTQTYVTLFPEHARTI
jgi:hypothetical protein